MCLKVPMNNKFLDCFAKIAETCDLQIKNISLVKSSNLSNPNKKAIIGHIMWWKRVQDLHMTPRHFSNWNVISLLKQLYFEKPSEHFVIKEFGSIWKIIAINTKIINFKANSWKFGFVNKLHSLTLFTDLKM